MLKRLCRVGLLAVCVGIPLSVVAQPEIDADDHAAVAEAFALARSQGYRFTSQSVTYERYTAADSSVIARYIALELDGEVSASGDLHNQVQIRVGSTLDQIRGNPPLPMEWVAVDGDVFILVAEDSDLVSMLPIEPGWWTFDDFMSHVPTQDGQVLLGSIISATVPTDIFDETAPIIGLTNQGDAEVAGHAVHNYEIQGNGLATVLRQISGTRSQRLMTILYLWRFYLSAYFGQAITAQVGDDGRLYRVQMQLRRYLPYLSAGYGSNVPYDVWNTADGEYTLTYSFRPIVITAPDRASLNH